MPGNLFQADISYPNLERYSTTEQKLSAVQDYLFMLLEQLKYTLSNLDKDNFNDTGLDEIGTMIKEPIYAKIVDDEGYINELAVTAQGIGIRLSDAEDHINDLSITALGLDSRIQDAQGNINSLVMRADSLSSQILDAQGNISILQQTASSLKSQISDAQGNISLIRQTATEITSRVSDNEGNISVLQQDATRLYTQVSDANGHISRVEQTADKISWIVASGTSEADFSLTTHMQSLIEQTSGSITLSVTNGERSSTITLTDSSAQVQSATIQFTGNIVFGSDIYSTGTTTIDGSKLTTGTVTADKVGAGTIYVNDDNGYTRGTITGNTNQLIFTASSDITLTNGSSAPGNIHIGGGAGSVYLDAGSGSGIYIKGTLQPKTGTGNDISIGGHLKPASSSWCCGTSSYPWNAVYTKAVKNDNGDITIHASGDLYLSAGGTIYIDGSPYSPPSS